jgi:ABC-type branched-subunit amino acid transport system ATPase component
LATSHTSRSISSARSATPRNKLVLRGIVSAHCSRLSRRFGDRLALDDVSFTLEPGEIFACSVRNGAGKTTTLRILAGLIAPDTDRLRLNGSAWGRSPRRSCGHASAFSPRRPGSGIA